ncbi:MAG: hypothetical protein M3548_07330 [Actinomycetota bacterium]|nr:hypothetical protein [Actinomycetota bacterium]
MAREHERAKAACGNALIRWRLTPGLNRGRLFPLDSAQAADVLGLAHAAAAVEVLLWARAFDDAARGSDGITAYPGYPGRSALPLEMKAARYAANKGVHLLVELAHVDHVPTIGGWGMVPFGSALVAPILRWVGDSSRLPAVKTDNRGWVDRGDQETRDAFEAHWCGKPVATGLGEVEVWLERWCLS